MSDPRPQTVADLHVCGTCHAELLQAVEWQQPATGFWQVLLRCPECEWSGTGVFTETEAEALAEETERGTASLLADLHTLAQANFEADVERFVAALDADLITPDDFA